VVLRLEHRQERPAVYWPGIDFGGGAARWHSRTDAVHKGEADRLLAAVGMLKQQGLASARMVRVFMHRRIQPLMAHRKPMHQYSSVNDPDRHSFNPIASSEIEARVRVITTLPLSSFMDEDLPHPLKKHCL
jgi:hypothetical protein